MAEQLPDNVGGGRNVHARAGTPFRFWGCSEIEESLGIRVDSERQLLERMEMVPSESIYHHTVRSLLLHGVVSTPYPDDFASWIATEVRDLPLAERLAFQSPFDFPDIDSFREHLLETIDDHLSQLPFDPRAIYGRPFHFLRGHLTSVPLEIEVSTLEGFRQALAEVDESSIYYHEVEAIGRLHHPRGDFAAWIDESLALHDIAGRIAEIDPFVLSLSRVRSQILTIIDEEMAHGEVA